MWKHQHWCSCWERLSVLFLLLEQTPVLGLGALSQTWLALGGPGKSVEGSYGILSECAVAKLSSWYNFIIVLLPSLIFQANFSGSRPVSVMYLLHCTRVSHGLIQAAAVLLSVQLPDFRSSYESISWCLSVTSNLGSFHQGSAGIAIPGSIGKVWGCALGNMV